MSRLVRGTTGLKGLTEEGRRGFWEFRLSSVQNGEGQGGVGGWDACAGAGVGGRRVGHRDGAEVGVSD